MTIHQEHETISDPAPTEQGARCARCRSPLADDQRYCLNCGQRRADAPLPFGRNARTRPAEPATPVSAAQPGPPWPPNPLYAGVGVALFALALALGVLIGSAGDDSPQQAAAPPPQVITVAGAGAAAAPAATFTSDWPDGQDGYTVQLRTLPKDGTEVAAVEAAKSDARSKGATDAAALDSDDFSSLDGGDYVIYTGVFHSRRQAKKELRGLKKDFPGAKIVEVSASGGLASKGDAGALSGKKKEATVGKNQLKDLQKLSPDQYQKKAKKLPDTTKLPGKAPPKDEKKPGGGGKGDVIG